LEEKIRGEVRVGWEKGTERAFVRENGKKGSGGGLKNFEKIGGPPPTGKYG